MFYRISLLFKPLQTRVFLSNQWVKLGKLKFSGHQELSINHIIMEKKVFFHIIHVGRAQRKHNSSVNLPYSDGSVASRSQAGAGGVFLHLFEPRATRVDS